MAKLPEKLPDKPHDSEASGVLHNFGGYDAEVDYFNGDNLDKYYFPEDEDPLNEIVEYPVDEYDDKDDPFFYHDGIFIDSATFLKLSDLLTGKGGLFQRRGHVAASDHGYAHIKQEEAERSAAISIQQTEKVRGILRSTLLDQGVAEGDIASKVDGIIESFRDKYSGSQEKRNAIAGDREYHLDNANTSLQLGRVATQKSMEL